MPVRLVFACGTCGAGPDPETHRALTRTLRELSFGGYLDAGPDRWLVWLGGGPLGPRRYACGRHRGELTAFLREHYGTISSHPWRRPPYPRTRRTADTERAIRAGGFGAATPRSGWY